MEGSQQLEGGEKEDKDVKSQQDAPPVESIPVPIPEVTSQTEPQCIQDKNIAELQKQIELKQ